MIRLHNMTNQTIVIPNHKQIKIGTLHSLYKKLREFLSDDEMGDTFSV